jgi:hypothetical protein
MTTEQAQAIREITESKDYSLSKLERDLLFCEIVSLLSTKEPETVGEWETSEEYEALQDCCVKGGADDRALPFFIRSLLTSKLDEQRERILREVIGEDEDDSNYTRMADGHYPREAKVIYQNELLSEQREKMKEIV